MKKLSSKQMNHREKIRKNLLKYSVTKNIDYIEDEWVYDSIVEMSNNCNLCGHKIKTNVIIRNKLNGVKLNIGVECADDILSDRESFKFYEEIEALTKRNKIIKLEEERIKRDEEIRKNNEERRERKIKNLMDVAKDRDKRGLPSEVLMTKDGVYHGLSNVEVLKRRIALGRI